MNAAILNIFRSGRVVGDALRRYRALALVGTASIVSVDILDALLPLVLKAIIDSIGSGDRSAVLWWCGLYVGVAIVQAIGRILWRVGFYQLGTRAARDIRFQLLEHLLKLPLPVVKKFRSGQIVSSSQSDVENVRTVLEHGMITLFDGVIYLVAIPLIMFWLSPGLAIVSLILLPAIPFIVIRNEKALKDAARAQQDAVSDLTNITHESFSSIRLIKSFTKEGRFAERFARASGLVADKSIALARREALFAPRLEVVISVSMTILLFFGGELVFSEQLTIGTYVAFQRYLQTLLWPTQAVGVWFSQLQRAAASSERIESVLRQEAPQRTSVPRVSTEGATPALVVEGLSFSFPESTQALLSEISFSLARGERLAIVGPSGSGKTTLLEFLTGARSVNEAQGKILLHGIDYQSIDVEWIREFVASVEQSPFLFSDSIRANIAPNADQQQVDQVIRLASIEQELRALPQGLETVIGERGVTLSGGQRQRVAIARALARKSSVLIWDNALSAVDLVTESRILESLKSLPEATAMIVVTHRLSTTLHMDRILVLNQGRIEQQGTHDELMRDTNGWYFAFCEHQKRISQLQALEENSAHD